METIAAPLREAEDVELVTLTLKPERPFPFPWPFIQFFDTFPETVHLDPAALDVSPLENCGAFDLIILGLTVWFLSPSQPATAFLQSPQAKALLAGKPVVTVIGCRNMWHNAYDLLRQLLKECGARHLDNVVLSDPSHPLASLVTTPRWMFTGRQNAFWGFPAAGIPADEIQKSRRFGLALGEALRDGRERGDQPLLSGLAAAVSDPRLIASERAAFRGFRAWGKLLRLLGKPNSGVRRAVVHLYVVYMFILVTTVVPASLLIQALLRPLLRARLERKKQQYELPSGSSSERIALYDQ